MKLEAELAGIHLEHPLMNAAGTCKLLEEVRELARSASSAIMVGSITVEERLGNPGNSYRAESMFSFNARGLPNRGAGYYKKNLPEMVAIAHERGKPLFVSVAGSSSEEYFELTELALEGGADLVELNMSCPNSERHIIPCFDPVFVDEVLRGMEERIGIDARVSIKLSPFSDTVMLDRVGRMIGASKLIKSVTAINSFPHALDGDARIDGFVGLAGPVVKPIGLGQVCQLSRILPNRVQITGVGGVAQGKDIQDYLKTGASVVQIATTYLQFGEGIFEKLIYHFLEIE